MFERLPEAEAEALAEFSAAGREVGNILQSWIANAASLDDYNYWNFLMHKVERCVRTGMTVAQLFCPENQYDATMPASGTLLARAERSLSHATTLRAAFLERQGAPLVSSGSQRRR
jgi:nitric oxide reductase activation protein